MAVPRYRLVLPPPYELAGGVPLTVGWLRVMVRWTCGPYAVRLLETALQSGIEITLRDILMTVQAASDVADPDTGIVYGDATLIRQATTGVPERPMQFILATLVYSGYLQDLGQVPAAAITTPDLPAPDAAEAAEAAAPDPEPATSPAPKRCWCGDPNCPAATAETSQA